MNIVSQSEMVHFFQSNKHLAKLYKKDAIVQARKAILGEEIITLIDGKIETHNFASENQVVIKGPKDEEYLISLNTFKFRYVLDLELDYYYKNFNSKGTCLAFQYTGEQIYFYASSGIRMLIEKFDFIGSPENIDEVYRIEKEIFFKTYKSFN